MNLKKIGGKKRKRKKMETKINKSLAIAFNIAKKGKVGDMIGFTVGKSHFTLVKDTGYVTEVKLRKLGKGGE